MPYTSKLTIDGKTYEATNECAWEACEATLAQFAKDRGMSLSDAAEHCAELEVQGALDDVLTLDGVVVDLMDHC